MRMRTLAARAGVLMAAGLGLASLSACRSYVGVEWVNDYSSVGKASLSHRDECARGFYDAIKARPHWIGRFERGDSGAWEKHFKRSSLGGSDTRWIDDVHFAYFAGHGAAGGTVAGDTGVGRGGGFTFGVDAHDDWVLGAIPGAREPRWGDRRLDWIVLDVCSALARETDGDGVEYTLSERWANAEVMRGLHYILGFRTSAYDDADRGRIFAEYLTGARDGTRYSVRQAWRKATEETERATVLGAYLRAESPGRDTFDDHIYEHGTVSADPIPAVQTYVHSSWSCL